MIWTRLCGWGRWRHNIFKARLKPGIFIVYNIGKRVYEKQDDWTTFQTENAILDNELKMSVAKKENQP